MLTSFTLAELIVMRDAVKTGWLKSVNATGYSISTRNLTRAQPDNLFKQLKQIEAEIAGRRQGSTGGLIQAAFPDDFEAGPLTDS